MTGKNEIEFDICKELHRNFKQFPFYGDFPQNIIELQNFDPNFEYCRKKIAEFLQNTEFAKKNPRIWHSFLRNLPGYK